MLHADRSGRAVGSERLDRLGVRHQKIAASGTSEDVALLLADVHGASLIIAVGTHATLDEFLDRQRAGLASTFLTRLRVGPKIVDAKSVPPLYAGRVRLWQLLLVLLAGVLALVVAIAVDAGGRRVVVVGERRPSPTYSTRSKDCSRDLFPLPHRLDRVGLPGARDRRRARWGPPQGRGRQHPGRPGEGRPRRQDPAPGADRRPARRQHLHRPVRRDRGPGPARRHPARAAPSPWCALPTAVPSDVSALKDLVGVAGGTVGGTVRVGKQLVDAGQKQLVDELGSQLESRASGIDHPRRRGPVRADRRPAGARRRHRHPRRRPPSTVPRPASWPA